jgi:hypothetical protein
MPVIISLAKGVEAALQLVPHIITPHKWYLIQVSSLLSLSLYKWVLKTLVLYFQDPSSSYGTADKGQRECLSDCLCAGCGFVINSSNCNHAFP